MSLCCWVLIQTPLGGIVAIADLQAVRVVQLVADRSPVAMVDAYQKQWRCAVVSKSNDVLDLLQQELDLYFLGKLQRFTVPVTTAGTMFQQTTWNALQKISYGKTVSYQQVALSVGSSKAMRAVGGANGANPIMIVIPCHRVIQADGKLGGYAGGIEHKKWLLEHEKNYV